MKNYVFTGVLLPVVFLPLGKDEDIPLAQRPRHTLGRTASYKETKSNVKKAEAHKHIRKNNVDLDALLQLKQASENIHRLGNISVGNPYTIFGDEEEGVSKFTRNINDDSCVAITRTNHGFWATKTPVVFERREIRLGGTIYDNLISSLGEDGRNTRLALKLSHIFAWDTDFMTDLHQGDAFK